MPCVRVHMLCMHALHARHVHMPCVHVHLQDRHEQLRPRRTREKMRVGTKLEEGVHPPPVRGIGCTAALGSARAGTADGGVEGVEGGAAGFFVCGRRAFEAETRLRMHAYACV